MSELPQELNAFPHVEEYFGLWGMWEPKFNALVSHAQQINVQLHLDRLGRAEMQQEIVAQANGEQFDWTIETEAGDTIAVVNLHNTLLKQVGSMSANTSTALARRKVRAATRSDKISGLLLHVDSPGGVMAGVSDLAEDVATAAAAKPTWAFIEDLGASAAYYVASQASQIFVNKTGLVGSIGVFSVVLDASMAAAQQGVKVHVIRAGQFKGAGVFGSEVTEEQIAEWQKTVDAAYVDFVSAVASGRKMTDAMVRAIADGRIHRGADAMRLNLIDGVQSLDATIAGLSEAGKLKPSRSSKAMSTEDKADVRTEQPATITELKAMLPGASADFVLAQVEAGATKQDAMVAFIQEQAQAVEAANKERDEAKAAAEKAKTAKPLEKPTQSFASKPITESGATESNDSPATRFLSAVQAVRTATGATWRDACAQVAKKDTEGHRAFLEANQQKARPDSSLTMV